MHPVKYKFLVADGSKWNYPRFRKGRVMEPSAELIADVLGGKDLLHRKVSKVDDLRKLVEQGLPYSSLEFLAGRSHIGIQRLSEIVGLSKTTRSRRRGEGILDKDESDRLCRFARVFAHALCVFQDEEVVATWFTSPNQALGKDAPIEIVRTDLGAKQVDAVLGRIEHGVFS